MTEQSIQSWSGILPSTNTSQNAMQDNIRRTTNESVLNEYGKFVAFQPER